MTPTNSPHDRDNTHKSDVDHVHPHDLHDHEHDEDNGHHDRDHSHDGPHESNHSHDHDHPTGLLGSLAQLFHLHGHGHEHSRLAADRAFSANSEGIRTVWIALGLLLLTSLFQIVIVWMSGSVALLADTIHNLGDGLNSVPLLIAFYLARRTANRRYTYGYNRAEDIAGIFIVLSIAFSAGVVFWQSYQKLVNPEPLTNLPWVAAAALIGFLGNEGVALLQIRVGRKIGSAALVADGLHARTDGLTSLAVLLAAGGAWMGFPIVDPIIGFVIGFAIVAITWNATVTIFYRLMDAVEPELLEQAEATARQRSDVKELRLVRMRWVGHELHAEVYIAVDPGLSVVQAHAIAEDVRHALFHEINFLARIVVHVDPWSNDQSGYHDQTIHHEEVPQPLPTS